MAGDKCVGLAWDNLFPHIFTWPSRLHVPHLPSLALDSLVKTLSFSLHLFVMQTQCLKVWYSHGGKCTFLFVSIKKSTDRFFLQIKEHGSVERAWNLVNYQEPVGTNRRTSPCTLALFITSLRAENSCSHTTKDMTRLYRCRTTRCSTGCLYLSGLPLCLYACTSGYKEQCVESIIKHDA